MHASKKRPVFNLMRSAAAAAAVAGLLLQGCEPEEQRPSITAKQAAPGTAAAEAAQGATTVSIDDNCVGSWQLYQVGVRAAGAARWEYDTDADSARRPFHRIALYEDGTLFGERIVDRTFVYFGGDWEVRGGDISMRCGIDIVAGEYAVEGDEFVVLVAGANGGEDILLILRPAYPLQKPEGFQDTGVPSMAPTNTTGTAGGTGAVVDPAPYVNGTSSGGSSGSGAFLWKPESENDGKAVTLFPSKYRLNEGPLENQIAGAFIDGGSRDGEEPRTVYWPDGHNGNRIHARWDATGGSYGDGFKVVLKLRTGQSVAWTVSDGGSRQEQ